MKLEELKRVIKDILRENFGNNKQNKIVFPDDRDYEPQRPDGHRTRIWDKDRKPKSSGKKIYDDSKPKPDVYRPKKSGKDKK